MALPPTPDGPGISGRFFSCRERLFLEHYSVLAQMARGIRRMFSKFRDTGVSTAPSIESRQSDSRAGGSGILPWLRSKKTAFAVIHNRRQGDTLGDHLEFALKYDGTNLAILASLFMEAAEEDILEYTRSKPAGKYVRRLWFL